MNISMADPFFNKEDRELINKSLDEILSNSLSMGENVKKFEKEFALKIGVKHAIAMNSCSSALEAALSFYNLNGRDVIVPVETFIASGMAIHLADGNPIFAEISKENLCLDINDLEKKISTSTAGVVLVHMAGLITPDIIKIKNFCKNNNIFLIEDAAHTPGAEIDNLQAGAIGDIGCFSFYPSKIITCGEGGMLTTNNDDIAQFARSYQNRGRDMNSEIEVYKQIGRNVRMPEFSALLGRVQLSHLDEYLKKRREIANIYNSELSKLNTLKVVFPKDIKTSSFWKLPVLLDKKFNREKIIIEMKKKGISVDSAYSPPLHLQSFFKKHYNTFDGQLKQSEELLKTHLCLPCHPRMTNNDINFVIENLKKILSSNL